MSVINRLEVANYLNLDNILPSQSGWRPDYIHLVLNFRGQSTAVVGTNGVGKTTLSRAIYAILSRDQKFTTDTRTVAAPKRVGAYSHIRLEVLYRDRPVGGLLGNMGADVPGEPYVLGLYCNSDSDIVFYAYQGYFEDCPVAIRTGTRVRILADQDFRAALRGMPRLLHNPVREEWLAFVAKHFDPAMLAQLVMYQKAGGGDSVEDFFKVKLRRADGQVDDYDSAFFFEFVAPEVLANAMRGFAMDSETRFEDTILQSATPLTRAELRYEQSAAALKRDQETFREIEKVNSDLDAFLEARSRVDRHVDELAGEVGFILDITEKDPLPGVPRQLEEMSERTNFVANRLVIAEQRWLVPDRLLAQLWDADAREVNQTADRSNAQSVRARQVVEILCDIDRSRTDLGGKPNRSFTLDHALALTAKRTKFAEGWTQADVERALRDGFRYRTEKGEANHLRPKLAGIQAKLAEAQKEEQETAERCDDTRRRLRKLTNRIESLKAEEYELAQIRRSGLFSGEEIANLRSLQSTTEDALRSAREEREGHQQRHAALKAERKAHEVFRSQWPDEDHPRCVLESLEKAAREASKAASKAGTAAKNAEQAARAAEAARDKAEQELEARREQQSKVESLLESVERFEALFPGEDPKGLEESVTGAHNSAIKEHADIRSARNQLGNEEEGLQALAPTWRAFRSIFPKDDPEGLEATITGDLVEAKACRDNLQKTRIPHVYRKLTKLEQGAKARHAVLERMDDAKILNSDVNGAEITGLERRLRARHALLKEDLGGLAKTLEQARIDRSAQDAFAVRFGTERPQDARERRRGEHAVATTERGKLKTQKADIKRQLCELSHVATAAGRVANEVIETIGGTPLRVHQIIDETLAGDDPRRELVVTHFSHVLHAPVAQTMDEARAMLQALEKAGIESAVFWKPSLVAFCEEAAIKADGGMALSIMAGLKTLQVEGLLDPHKIEQTRQRRAAELARISAALDELEDNLADLDEASLASAIVRNACDAVERGLIDRLSGFESRFRSIEAELAQIDGLLEDDFVADIRMAETFVDQGGDDALAQVSSDVAKLEEELTGLKGRIADLQCKIKTVPTIRKALRFQSAGGEERLLEIGRELTAMAKRIDAIEHDLPRLKSRLDAIPEIRAALRFQEMGGREGLACLISEIVLLEKTRDQTREEANATRITAHAASEAQRRTEADWTDRRLDFERRRPVLATAAAYLESGGLEFDRTYKDVLSSLKDDEKRCDRRANFRFGLALLAFEAESAGESTATLQAERTTLERQADDDEDRIQELTNEANRLAVQVSNLKPLVERIDHVAAELTTRRRQARQATTDAELTPERIARAPQSKELTKAMLFASHLREEVTLQERSDKEIIDALEDLECDTRALSLHSRLPSIKEARGRKDQAWKTYFKSVETLRHNKEIALAESDRALLEEALAESGMGRVTEILKTFERHLASSAKKHEDVQQDIEAQKQQLSESLKAFTLNVGENFKLLKSCLRPANPGDAGFEIKASVVDRTSIREAVDKVISMIKSEERQRTERVRQGTSLESQRDYDERIRKAIRDIFYRSIFTGAGNSESERRAPRILLRHPRIGGGKRMRLTKKISTGQRQGLGLLFMTKMADFAISRDERFDLSAIGRRKAVGHQARVVMIDGLFSNLSNRKLIRESLDALRDLKGKFQLIGWIHYESYENDPEIFPEYVALRRIGDTEGFVVVDCGEEGARSESENQGNRPSPGNVAAVEMHVDPLTGAPAA